MGMTLQSLTQAIQQHIDTEMDAEVAAGMAEHALGFFGFYNRIIDNALEPTDRNLFYMFQDYDLLTTESEETTLWDGRSGEFTTGSLSPTSKNALNLTCNASASQRTSIRLQTSMEAMDTQSGHVNLKRFRIQMPSPAIGDICDQAFLFHRG